MLPWLGRRTATESPSETGTGTACGVGALAGVAPEGVSMTSGRPPEGECRRCREWRRLCGDCRLCVNCCRCDEDAGEDDAEGWQFGDGTVIDDMGMEVPAPRVPARNGLGYVVQAGFLIPRVPLEITGRWGQIVSLGDVGQTSLPDSEEVGGGVSWYFLRHSLKVQADYFRLRADHFDIETLSFTREPWSRSVDQFRVQLQLAF